MEDMADAAREREADGDAVDWFAREILKYPERAESLKRGFRERLAVPGTSKQRADADDSGDVEDLWDNVPI